MTRRDRTEIDDPADLSEQDLAIATLLGRYIERRERQDLPEVRDLVAAAAEFGDDASLQLLVLIDFYEAMREADR